MVKIDDLEVPYSKVEKLFESLKSDNSITIEKGWKICSFCIILARFKYAIIISMPASHIRTRMKSVFKRPKDAKHLKKAFPF